MGVQEPANNALRTIWTKAMDRYFIDLMLEQVGKGSRVDGHLFSKRAWRHMTLLFNEKFRLQYSRDHLKNRHKTLRRVYRAVKNLLEHSEFTWDDTQHMVTADDCVWSNYTKAHPEARSYRTKSIPHYSDMRKIFKNACTLRQSDVLYGNDHNKYFQGAKIGGVDDGLQLPTTYLAQEDLIDEEKGLGSSLDGTVAITELDVHQLAVRTESLLSPNNGMEIILHELVCADTTSATEIEENAPFSTEYDIDAVQTVPDGLDAGSCSRSRTYWQPPMDSYFTELMLEQVHLGNQFDGTFRKHAWMHMTELFNAKFGYKYNMAVLKNRYKTLKRQYTALKVLLDQKGFLWDDTRQMVIADDHIWHDYIKVHPDAKQYITRSVPHFSDLSVIFKDVVVDERYSGPACNLYQQNEVLAVANGDYIDNASQESSSHLDIDTLDGKNKRQFATQLACQDPKRSRRNYDGIVDAIADATMVESSHLGVSVGVSDMQNNDEVIASQHHNTLRNRDEGIANALHEMAAVISALSDKMTEHNNSSLTEDVIRALQDTPDIDDDLILDACDLFEDEKKAKTFLSLDVRLRMKWLTRKLRP